uniref:Uncharacterized protein n=1 Tax=Alexandrium andersonii TaxID=327968 RepID=A0A7S2B1C3_9DINO
MARDPEPAWPRRFVSGLLAKNAKPHEHQHWLVGISCLLLGVPIPFALANDDRLTGAWLVLVTACSLLADFAYIGSLWNVLDRWVAVSFTVYLTYRAFLRVPRLTTANLFVVAAMLAYSQCSRTREQWRWRHSLWHAVMMVDITFFLDRIYSVDAAAMAGILTA